MNPFHVLKTCFRQCIFSVPCPCNGSQQDDKITVPLPGYEDEVNFSQYSGYLRASTDGDVQLHYWLVKSQRSAADDPLVLWLNGGPGSSSLYGFFFEHGPFNLRGNDSTLSYNSFSWNRIANIIYLESPACVGYSYSKSGNCSCDDAISTEQNIMALEHFLRKFPEFSGRNLYLTGQSYAAVYLSLLGERILSSQSNLTKMLKGVAIGNGLLNGLMNKNSQVTYAFSHGMLSQSEFVQLTKQCNCSENSWDCDFFDGKNRCRCGLSEESDSCRAMMRLSLKADTQWNKYNILQKNPTSKDVAEKWMNNVTSKRALNIRDEAGNRTWKIHSSKISYKKQDVTTMNLNDSIKSLVDQEIHVLIFNGDLDSVCNFLGAQMFVRSLGIPSNSSRIWLTEEGEVGGLETIYTPFLRFLVVRGAGHSVAKDRPEAAFTLFNRFISQKL